MFARILAGLLLFSATLTPAAERKRFGDETSGPRFGRDRTVDALHYRLDLAFDPDTRQVRGTVSIRFSPLRGGLEFVELDAGPMSVERVTLDGVDERGPLPFGHDGRTLRVELPRAFGPEETLTLSVSYAARPRGGLYFVGPDEGYPDKPRQVWSQGEAEKNRNWFPAFDYPNDRATSEEIYTVPEGWTAIGNGKLVAESTREPGTRTFHYRMDQDHVAYLISIIAGKFEKYVDEFDGTPVEYYVPLGTGREKTLRSFGRTPEILRFYSERTGVRYPYPKYTQTCAVDFIHGGMENISATTQSVNTLHDARAALERDSLALVAHEAAHQWFGDLVTCASWSHAWLNEGLTTYWENLWFEEAMGQDEFLYRMLQDRESYLEEDRTKYRHPIVQQRYTDPMDIFDAHLFAKGAWVQHMLRGVLGDDAFFEAMAHYTRSRSWQLVETVDLRRAIAEATGVDLERFFDQWLRHGGHPEFVVTRSWDAKQSVLTLHIEQVQQVDDLTPVFTLPVQIAVDTAEGTTRRRVQIERAAQDVTLELPAEPLLVRFDPDFRLLCELDLERSAEETVRALERDPNAIGRIFAARDLADDVPTERAIPPLAEALASDGFHGVRIEAAEALGKLGGDGARDALIAALRDDDSRVRTAAAGQLGKFDGDERVAKSLMGLLDDSQGYGTYATAVRSLAEIGAPQARKIAVRALGVDSDRERIRAAAFEALVELEAGDAFDTLRRWMAYGKPSHARRAAIGALPKLAFAGKQRDEAVGLLLALLDDPDHYVRWETIRALGKLPSDAALDSLSRSAKVEFDSRLRRAARASIAAIRAGESGDED